MIDRSGRPFGTDKQNLRLYEFVIPVSTPIAFGITAEGIKSMLDILRFGQIFQILYMILIADTTLMVDLMERGARTKKSFCDKAMNLSALHRSIVLKSEPQISSPSFFLRKNLAVRVPQSPKIGNLIHSFIPYDRNPTFMHTFNYMGLSLV